MIVPPIPEHPEASRPWFKRLRDLRDSFVAAGTPAATPRGFVDGHERRFRSGRRRRATIVRVGSAIFGRRAQA
jgi:uncharacterized pyridoxal phosphate-containing UPF0001 family protein